ncbi:MAG TPA: glycosyltransferase family 2 protein [Patescibacteria group bacterium]|nr:glycosyltransferase family 2 protein [Patescibacteria group bacterium]
MSISVVISTRNRSGSLTRTLRSVKDVSDEVIVVDNESTDDTVAVAKRFGARVYTKSNNLMLNVNKNYGFTKATKDWILCLDDDEEIPKDLVEEIKQVTHTSSRTPHNSDAVGFWIPRKNIIFGKWIQHGIWWPDRQLRLFRRGRGIYPEKHVHEYVEVNGSTQTLDHPYVHYNYDSLSQFLEKMQVIYTESEVQKHVSAGYRVRWTDAIRFPLSDFVKLYFAQKGYKDGLHGLVLSFLQAFYSFIIFVKLWEREKFREIDIPLTSMSDELGRAGREVTYWKHTAFATETRNPVLRLLHRLLRRISLLS